MDSTTIFLGLFAYGAGYLIGNLTSNLRTWKLFLLLLMGAGLYIAALAAEPFQLLFFLLGMASHHFGRLISVMMWAHSLSDVIFGMRYRTAFDDIRRREKELEEWEQRLREEERRRGYEERDRGAGGGASWQQEARNFRQKPGEDAKQDKANGGSSRSRAGAGAKSGSAGEKEKQAQGGSRGAGGQHGRESAGGGQGSGSSNRRRPDPPPSQGGMDRHLEVLGLKPGRDYSPDEIKKAYRRAVKKHHPDVGGSDAAMTAVNLAYDALMKRAKRQGG